MLRTIRFVASHPLTADRPLSGLWRLLRWQVVSRLRKELTIKWIGDSRLVVRNGMTGATGNIYCGLHEFADMGLAMHLLRPGDVFVDVGANVGSYTVLASRVCGARTIAVEPDPDAVDALRRNIAANRIEDLAAVRTVALGASIGTANFTIGKDTLNQVVDRNETDSRIVEMSTLDEVVQDETPTLIKMDVEGHEHEVLKAASRTLENSSLLAIQTENADTLVARMLERHGFARMYYDPFHRAFSGSRPQGHSASNALYLRQLPLCRDRVAGAPVRRVLHHQL